MAFQPGGFQHDAIQIGRGQVVGVGLAEGAVAGDSSDALKLVGVAIAEAALAGDGPQPVVVNTWHAAARGAASVAVTITTAQANSLLLVLLGNADETGGSLALSSLSGSGVGATFTQQTSDAGSAGSFSTYAYTKVLSSQLVGEIVTATWGAASGTKQITIVEIAGYSGSTPVGALTTGNDAFWAAVLSAPATVGGAHGWSNGGWSGGSLVFSTLATQDTVALSSTTPDGNSTKISDDLGANSKSQVVAYRLTGLSTTTEVTVGASDARSNLSGVGIEILPGTAGTSVAQDAIRGGAGYADGAVAAEAEAFTFISKNRDIIESLLLFDSATAEGHPARVDMVEAPVAAEQEDSLLNTPLPIQHHSSSALVAARGLNGNDFKFTLPAPVQAGNCLILAVSYLYGSTRVVSTISDTSGDTWSTTPSLTQTDSAHLRSDIFVLPNASGGVHTITVSLNSSTTVFSYCVSEFNNIASSSPVNGTASTLATAPSLASGNFTPGNNDLRGGNLIWSYFIDQTDGSTANWVTNFSPGAGSHLLHGDIAWHANGIPHAAQFQIQTASAVVNPGITATMTSSNDTFNCLSIALKIAPGGSPPPAKMRIRKALHGTNESPPGGANWNFQLPCSEGNLIIWETANFDSITTITGVTDNKGNTWNQIHPDPSVGQIWWAGDTAAHGKLVTGEDLVISVAISGSPTPQGCSACMYEIVSALADPVDVTAFATPVTCSNVSTVNDIPTMSVTAEGFTLAVAGLGQGPGLGFASGAPAGALFALVTYTGETDIDTLENADLKGHFYNTTPQTIHWNWTITPIVNNSAQGVAAHFKGQVSLPDDLGEAATAAEQEAAGLVFAGSYSEAAQAGESETAALVIPATYAEAALAGEAYAYPSGMAYVDGAQLVEQDTIGLIEATAYAEAPAAGESEAALQAAVATYAEAPVAGEADDATEKLLAAYAEGAAAGDAEDASQRIPATAAEALVGGDAYTLGLVLATAYSEGPLAAEAEAALQREVATYADGGLAGEAETAALVIPAGYSDGALLSDAYDSTKVSPGQTAIVEGAVALDAEDASQKIPATEAEGALAGDASTALLATAAAYADAALAGESEASQLRAVAAYSDGAAALDAEDATERISSAYSDGAAASDQVDQSPGSGPPAYVEGLTLAEQETAGLRLSEALAEGALAGDVYDAVAHHPGGTIAEALALAESEAARQRGLSALAELALPAVAADATRVRPGSVQRGLYAPTTIPTWVPTLMLSLGQVAREAVFAAAGGRDLVLESPSALGIGAPAHPRTPDDGSRSAWQYEGFFYRAAVQYGLRIRPGALYLAVTSGLVRIRLVNPGPTVWLALPNLSEAVVSPLVDAMNALALNPPPGPLPAGRLPWKSPAGNPPPLRTGLGLWAPDAVGNYVPTLMLALDQKSQAAVVAATGGPAAVLVTTAPLLGAAPLDPRRPAAQSFWQYEGDFYAAARRRGLRIKPGAIYRAVVTRALAARLVAPGPVAWFGLPDLSGSTVAAAVASANALV